MERQNSVLLENVYKMTIYSSQMQIWKVHINTGGYKEHPNTETERVRKKTMCLVVPRCCNDPLRVIFIWILLIWSQETFPKDLTYERQQPIWQLRQKETLPGLSMRDNLGQLLYKGAQSKWAKEMWNRLLWDQVKGVRLSRSRLSVKQVPSG